MTTSPTHARYRVVALATALGMITYLDRACIATLAPGIVRDLGLSTGTNGLCVHGLPAGLCALRDSHRLVGGSPRHSIRSLTHRAVVVMPDGGDGRRVQLSGHARRPLPVRHGRGGRMAVRGPHVLALDSRSRTRQSPGSLLRRCAPGRRTDADARALAAQLPAVAHDLHLLRLGRIHLGRRLARLVPQRSRRSTRRSTRRSCR